MNVQNSSMYSKLAGGTALCALVGGTAAPRIYYQQAPENTASSYVVFNVQSAVEPNDSPHRLLDTVWFVRGYSTNALTAGSIDAEIDTLLDGGSLTITGWQTLWLEREQHFENVENAPSGSAVYMAGGFYRCISERSS